MPETKQQDSRKAVLYCRVSSARQVSEGAGLASQEMRCREYCAARKYDVTALFTDDVSGGGDFMKRPGMVQLLRYLDDNPQNQYVVVFDDLKRYARDTVFHLKLRQEMALRNATRECLNFKFEDTPEGEFIETVIAAQSQLERQQNSRQVRQKMYARIMAGYYCFACPPGYAYKNVAGQGKMLVRDEPLASVIQEGLEGFASGRFETQSELQRFFESFPVFPRDKSGNIHLERIKELLTRIIYAGYVEAPGWGIAPRPAKHSPLISLATHQRIQANLNGTAKAPARKDISEIFPLRNFVLCGDCGGPLTSCLSKGRNGHHPYYLCHKKGCASYGKSIRQDVIEGEFAELVADMQPSKDAINTATKMFRMAWDYRLTSGASIAATAKQELATLDRGIGQLLDRILETDNQTVIRKYEERIEDMEKQKLLLAEKLAKTGQPVRSFDDILRTALLFLQNPLKLWLGGGLEEKRMLLRMAFTSKLEYVRNQGFRTAPIALPFKAFSEFKGGILKMVDRAGIEPATY